MVRRDGRKRLGSMDKVDKNVDLGPADVIRNRTDDARQVRRLDDVIVDENQMPHAKVGQLLHHLRTGPTASDNSYARSCKLPLTCRTPSPHLAVHAIFRLP